MHNKINMSPMTSSNKWNGTTSPQGGGRARTKPSSERGWEGVLVEPTSSASFHCWLRTKFLEMHWFGSCKGTQPNPLSQQASNEMIGATRPPWSTGEILLDTKGITPRMRSRRTDNVCTTKARPPQSSRTTVKRATCNELHTARTTRQPTTYTCGVGCWSRRGAYESLLEYMCKQILQASRFCWDSVKVK